MSCDTTWQPRPASSTEYLWATIEAFAANGSAVNPSTDPVSWRFRAMGTADWLGPFDGIWRTVTEDEHGRALADPEYQAGILIGPENDGTPLDPARYRARVKVTDNPEVVERDIDQILHITEGSGS